VPLRTPALCRARRITRALLCLTLAVFSFTSKAAWAATLVPMCGEHAQTVVAPPISRAARDFPLAPLGCDKKADRHLESGPSPQRAPEPPALEFVPRVPPIRYVLAPPPCYRADLDAGADGERSAHRSNIERPPR
jgi:hypothetical protein